MPWVSTLFLFGILHTRMRMNDHPCEKSPAVSLYLLVQESSGIPPACGEYAANGIPAVGALKENTTEVRTGMVIHVSYARL